MPGANSVTSNQESLHKDLEKVVRKYARTTFLRPIANHTYEAFAKAEAFVQKFYNSNADCCDKHADSTKKLIQKNTKPLVVILDSGCGTGESTTHIARRFPNIPVIGIDKSEMRLSKAGNPVQTACEHIPQNAFWIRAELLDFWRLALDRVKTGEWTIPYHALYYPNPWPKQSEATRRFHMHPIFPTLIALGKNTELRTNWEIYAQEFARAAQIILDDSAATVFTAITNAEYSDKKADVAACVKITCDSFEANAPETAFERKYKEARQKLWRVMITTDLPQT